MPRRLPISGVPPREEAPRGGLGEGIWSRGQTFLEIVESQRAVADVLDATFKAVRLPATLERFYTDFPRQARVLALTNLAEPQSLRLLAQAERLFSLGRTLWMRTFPVTEHPDLVQRFPSTGWPLLLFFGEDRLEFARWEPASRNDATPTGAPQVSASPPDSGQSLARDLARLLAPYAGLPEP